MNTNEKVRLESIKTGMNNLLTQTSNTANTFYLYENISWRGVKQVFKNNKELRVLNLNEIPTFYVLTEQLKNKIKIIIVFGVLV